MQKNVESLYLFGHTIYALAILLFVSMAAVGFLEHQKGNMIEVYPLTLLLLVIFLTIAGIGIGIQISVMKLRE